MRVRVLSNESIRDTALKVSKRGFRDLQITAHHEAGHAVAAWRLGLKFKYVTILPDKAGRGLGHVMNCRPKWFRPDIDSSDRICLLAQRRITSLFAGQLAEAKFRRRKPLWGSWSDDRQAVDLAMRMCGSQETTEAYLKYCFLASRDLVNVFWPEVEGVAWGLLELQTADYQEVIELISPGSAVLRDSLEAGVARKVAVRSVESRNTAIA